MIVKVASGFRLVLCLLTVVVVSAAAPRSVWAQSHFGRTLYAFWKPDPTGYEGYFQLIGVSDKDGITPVSSTLYPFRGYEQSGGIHFTPMLLKSLAMPIFVRWASVGGATRLYPTVEGAITPYWQQVTGKAKEITSSSEIVSNGVVTLNNPIVKWVTTYQGNPAPDLTLSGASRSEVSLYRVIKSQPLEVAEYKLTLPNDKAALGAQFFLTKQGYADKAYLRVKYTGGTEQVSRETSSSGTVTTIRRKTGVVQSIELWQGYTPSVDEG